MNYAKNLTGLKKIFSEAKDLFNPIEGNIPTEERDEESSDYEEEASNPDEEGQIEVAKNNVAMPPKPTNISAAPKASSEDKIGTNTDVEVDMVEADVEGDYEDYDSEEDLDYEEENSNLDAGTQAGVTNGGQLDSKTMQGVNLTEEQLGEDDQNEFDDEDFAYDGEEEDEVFADAETLLSEPDSINSATIAIDVAIITN